MKQFLKQLLGLGPSAPPPRANKALWAIGILAGPSPLDLASAPGVTNPVITRDHVTDVPASFVADPFLMRTNDRWHLFFEVLNRSSKRGEIALSTSPDLATWTYERVVLAEPFHLSYPFVFEWDGTIYMVPETHETQSIRLYRADPFPHRWTHVHTLLSGQPFADSTLFRHDGRWWMFTECSPALASDTLRLYHADALSGPWIEHPASPIVSGDAHRSRPAGRVLHGPDGLFRLAQDCAPRYGSSVQAFEITALTTATYVERPARPGPVLAGSGSGWNADRMHHGDAHEIAPGQWIAAVDGARNVTAAVIAGEA